MNKKINPKDNYKFKNLDLLERYLIMEHFSKRKKSFVNYLIMVLNGFMKLFL